MKSLNVRTRISAILLSGFILVGSSVGIIKAKANDDYELKSIPIAELLEDEDIQKITTIDEELEDIDLIEKDAEFRKQIMYLNYYKSSGEEDLYNETLDWLRNNFEDTASEILLDSAKGAIADEEATTINSVTLTPAPDYNEDSLFFAPKGVAAIKKDYYKEGYTIESKQLNNAINLCASIQDTNFNEASAKDIVKLYDEVIETAKMTIASGASRHDDKIEEKNSKKYIKKNFNI